MKLGWMKMVVGIGLVSLASLSAQTPAEKIERLLEELRLPGVIETSIGVTRKGTPIPALITEDDLDYFTTKTRILLVGGLDGSEGSVRATVDALRWFYASEEAAGHRDDVALSAVPVANPDGWALGVGPSNGSGGDPTVGYPPEGTAYNSKTNPEAAYLWRWIGMHAPDLVVEFRGSEYLSIGFPDSSNRAVLPDNSLALSLMYTVSMKSHYTASNQLTHRLSVSSAASIGSIFSFQLTLRPEDAKSSFQGVLEALDGVEDGHGMSTDRYYPPSNARHAIQSRLKRTPLEVAQQLAQHYGHKLDQVAYIPALALVGRLRLADLTPETNLTSPMSSESQNPTSTGTSRRYRSARPVATSPGISSFPSLRGPQASNATSNSRRPPPISGSTTKGTRKNSCPFTTR